MLIIATMLFAIPSPALLLRLPLAIPELSSFLPCALLMYTCILLANDAFFYAQALHFLLLRFHAGA